MGDRYMSADSPRGVSDERYAKLVQETSKGISSFNQLTRSMAQKMSLFGTPQDTRANHTALRELADKGNKIVSKINKRMLEINKACQGPQARTRKTQVAKLSVDFKTQVKQFEDTCKRLMDSERRSIENIRRSSQSFNHDDLPRPQSGGNRKGRNGSGGGRKASGGNGGNVGGGGLDLNNYNEDQLYAQANIIRYDEDDLARREEDIIHINHQLREVNAAFREIDGLVQDQGEVIVEIEQNTDDVKDNVSKALNEVRQADKRKSYCACSRMKMMCYGGVALILLVVLVAVISNFT